MVTIFCTNERVFDISFSLFYPYITEFTSFENSKSDNFSFEYNGLPFFCKCLSHGDIVNSDDIICIPDSTVENFKNNYQLFSKFKNNKKISFFTEGESYSTNDNIFHFLDIGGKIITSSIKSKIYDDNNFDKLILNKNVLSSLTSTIYNFSSKPELKLLNFLSEINLPKSEINYDISFYSRYGYKKWRDKFTDLIRGYGNKLSINEISNTTLNDGESECKIIQNKNLKSFYLKYNLDKKVFHDIYYNEMCNSHFHVVYETSLEEPSVFLTEKTQKEYLFGFLFYNISSFTLRQYLKNMGFYSLDMDTYPEVESKNQSLLFDREEERIEYKKFNNFMSYISSLSETQFTNFIHEKKKLASNNKKILKEILFEKNIYREGIINFILE